MFKKIQNHLLLHHPLLWNLKIVPVLAVAIILHSILFIMGYTSGTIDFTITENDYIPDVKFAIITFFCVVIAVFTLIIWLVFYSRNNSFKSFYPKNNGALYKEWLLILFVCIVNSTYPLTYFYASNIRATSYLTEDEFAKRIDIISMASIFAGDDFNTNEVAEYDSITGKEINFDKAHYFGKLYYRNSLMNKAMYNFPYNDFTKDSVSEYRVKRWLYEGRKDSILWLMGEMDKIVKYHKLKSTITPQQWLDKIYNAPGFTRYADIATTDYYIVNLNPDVYNYEYDDGDYEYGTNYNEEYSSRMRPDTVVTKTVGDSLIISNRYDTISVNIVENDVRMIKGIRHIYAKNMVPFDRLENAYSEISRAYSDRNTELAIALSLLYFCFTLSALILSFRVTSGRNWLISLVSFGIAAITTGILFVFIDEMVGYPLSRFTDEGYFVFWVIIEITLLAILFFKKKRKSITAVVLNIAVWLLPWLLPTISGILMETYSDYYRMHNHQRPDLQDTFHYYIAFIAIAFIVIHFISMYFFTQRIKQWKGLAEA
jgi:hypothetical protein